MERATQGRLQFQFLPAMLWAIGQARQDVERCCQMGHCLCHCRALDCLLPSLLPVADSFLDEARQGAMVRHQLRSSLDVLCETLLEGLHNPAMKLLASAPQQTLVSSILNQSMLEDIGRLWRNASAEDEFGLSEPAQCVL
jgi:hypothetical protein